MNGQGTAQNRYLPGNRIALLRDGAEYFPALVSAIETAEREIWLESYIFADDAAGRLIACSSMAGAPSSTLPPRWNATSGQPASTS